MYLENHEMIQLNDVRILVTLHSMHILLLGYILLATLLCRAGLPSLNPGRTVCSPKPNSTEQEKILEIISIIKLVNSLVL